MKSCVTTTACSTLGATCPVQKALIKRRENSQGLPSPPRLPYKICQMGNWAIPLTQNNFKKGGQMASIKKFPQVAIPNELRHLERLILNDSNKDINKAFTYLNYRLSPKRAFIFDSRTKSYREMTDYEYYKWRKNELYCYRRADVKTMAGWVITAPRNLAKEDERAFFESVYHFLVRLYGVENVVSCWVHYDEGRREKIITWEGPVYDEYGNIKTHVVPGRPHMHFYFIPVVPDSRHKEGYKICANDLINKVHLQRFHGDLEAHLRSEGIYCSVRSGITHDQGRNYFVSELKSQHGPDSDFMYSPTPRTHLRF